MVQCVVITVMGKQKMLINSLNHFSSYVENLTKLVLSIRKSNL